MSIESKIIEIISDKSLVEKKKFNRETKLADLEMDSLDNNDLLIEIEDKYDILIPSEVEKDIKTVGDVIDVAVRFIEEK